MLIFKFFSRQNLIQIYTKTHHLKKISRGHAAERPYQSTWFPNLKKRFLTPPPPAESWLGPCTPIFKKKLGEGGGRP